MNNQIYNDKVIEAIKEKLAKDQNLTTVLSETLFLGKEALYRRLRNIVPFTFAEIVTLCEKFDISLDSVIKKENSKKAVFDLNIVYQYDSMDAYYNMILSFVNNMKKLKSYPNHYTLMALNIMPYMFYQPLENISKFNFFKWRYIMNNQIDKTKFSEFELSDEVKKIQKEATRETISLVKSYILISPKLFEFFLNDIKYFRQINLITDEDLSLLKQELNMVLDELEYMTIHGKFRKGNDVLIYISNIDFLTPYTYYGSDGYQFVHFRICVANSIDSNNQTICELKKNWILSLMKASTLISLSGGIERMAFFDKQRKLINAEDNELDITLVNPSELVIDSE